MRTFEGFGVSIVWPYIKESVKGKVMSHIDRMKAEYKELKTKVDALDKFLVTDIFKGLHAFEQQRMIKQLGFMEGYLRILEERLWVAIY